MATWDQNVYSSMVNRVSYDTETKEMTVVFNKGGRTYVYAEVPEALAQQLANAGSVGNFLNAEIKPYFSFRRVS